jgi:Concanavalin A-like lectin/glucanases superfamily
MAIARRFQTSDNIVFAHDGRFDTSGWNTVFGWIKDNSGSGDDVIIVSNTTNWTDGFAVAMGLNGTDRILYLYVNHNFSSAADCPIFNDTNWHSFALQFTDAGTDDAILYFDGSLTSATAAASSFTLPSNDLTIGYDGNGGNLGDVSIDNLFWWKRQLSSSEIAELHAGTTPAAFATSLILAAGITGDSPEPDQSSYGSPTGTVTGTTTVTGNYDYGAAATVVIPVLLADEL